MINRFLSLKLTYNISIEIEKNKTVLITNSFLIFNSVAIRRVTTEQIYSS